MPKVPRHYHNQRRQQILDAARACFARKGVHATTMRDIYRQADLSPGAVYHYFDSKEQLIDTIYAPDEQRNIDLLAALRDRRDTLRALEETVDFFWTILDGLDPERALSINIQTWAEAQHNPRVMEVLRRSFGAYLEAFSAFFRRAQARGQVNPRLDSRAIAHLVVGSYLGLELLKSLDPDIDVSKHAAVVKAALGGDFWHGTTEDSSHPNPHGGRNG